MVNFKAISLSLILFLSAVEAGMLCECQSIRLQRESRSELERDFVNKVNRSTVKSEQMSCFCSSVTISV